MSQSMPSEYFDALYANDPDPWRFASSSYEQTKYNDTIRSLSGRRFNDAFEVGCSIGVLTRRLASCCRQLLAVDVAEAALSSARVICADRSNVEFERRRVPDYWPAHRFDLIVFSEVLYYLNHEDICRVADRACASLIPGGVIVMVHWTGGTDYPVSGDEAAATFLARCAGRLHPDLHLARPDYRLDRLSAAAKDSQPDLRIR